MRPPATLALVAAFIAVPCNAAPAGSSAAFAALSHCIKTPDVPPAGAISVQPPPGLARAGDVNVEQLPARGYRLFTYQGTGNEIVCGIALYGRVPANVVRSLTQLLDRQTRWARHSPGPYHLGADQLAKQTYWGDPKAPGISGALMFKRRPSASSPTIAIDVHTILVK